MSRLVVQHPALSDLSVQVFSASIGFAPVKRQAGVAIWSDVKISSDQVTFLAERHRVDAEFVPDQDPLSNYRLIAFDMDSTLITVECIDEIAAYAGRKAEVATITEATMRGEIRNFADSLRQRVAQLAGLPEQVLETVYQEKVALSDGATTLIEKAQLAGLKTLLVSGGFTFFTSRLAERLSFTTHRANELEIIDGHLTGRVLGDIVDGEAKRRTVIQTCSELGCDPDAAIVIGDGANDLPMMSVAGVSVAFHAKPIVRSETTHAINYGGLDGALHYFTE